MEGKPGAAPLPQAWLRPRVFITPFFKNVKNQFSKIGWGLLSVVLLLVSVAMVLPAGPFDALGLHDLYVSLHPAGVSLAAAPIIAGIKQSTFGANPGGTTKLFVIPFEDVESIPAPGPDGVTVATDIAPKAGKAFAEWEFAQDTGQITAKVTGDQGSQVYELEKKIYISTITPEIQAVLQACVNRRFIIVVVDGRGQKVIGGDLLRPMSLEQNQTTGAKFNDKSGTELTFKCGSSHAPYFYTGAIPLQA